MTIKLAKKLEKKKLRKTEAEAKGLSERQKEIICLERQKNKQKDIQKDIRRKEEKLEIQKNKQKEFVFFLKRTSIKLCSFRFLEYYKVKGHNPDFVYPDTPPVSILP